MELMILCLLLIVVAVFQLVRSRPTGEPGDETSPGASLPRPQNDMAEELDLRILEFLERDHFVLMIQPVVDLQTNRICSGEVLSRLNHPEQGMIFPDTFLPAIDAAGLYPRFDRYIFEKACAWLSRSAADGESLDFLSCNFSRKTLSGDNLAGDLAAIADRYGLPHDKLGIEITEGEKETDTRQFHDNLQQLKARGFRIFLDDFGSGVTSVTDLMRYPLDVVKIDRSILLTAETEQGKAAYRALVGMAGELGAKVTCEGIETEEQHRLARESGCHYGQGFLFYRPMSPSQTLDMTIKCRIRQEDV